MLNLNKGNKDIKRHFGILGHSVLSYAFLSAMHIKHIFIKRPSLALN